MSYDYAVIAPALDPGKDLYNALIGQIHTHSCQPSKFYMDGTNNNGQEPWFNRLYQQLSFSSGKFQIYTLSPTAEDLVYKHYQTFIDHVGAPYKIRLKAMSNVRWLLPHSDRYNNENGDACSIHIALDVNNEITNWYQFEGQFKMFNPLHVARLKKQKSIQLKNGQACLFDNQSIHSVTNCHPNKTRWCVSISWQHINYQDLVNTFLKLHAS
jgi:hypothetical protein